MTLAGDLLTQAANAQGMAIIQNALANARKAQDALAQARKAGEPFTFDGLAARRRAQAKPQDALDRLTGAIKDVLGAAGAAASAPVREAGKAEKEAKKDVDDTLVKAAILIGGVVLVVALVGAVSRK